MSDEIRGAYICGYEAGHNDTVESCYGDSAEKADEYIMENCITSRNDEISELVEALSEALAEEQETLDLIGGCDHEAGICCCTFVKKIEKHVNLLSRYTKTPCPECGGDGFDHNTCDPKPCPDCKGRGYKWEKIGNG